MDKFWKFVNDNIYAAPAALRLKYHGKDIDGIDIELTITQIECRQKFSKKLSVTLSRLPQFIFPTVLAGEQSTSDLLASYHASRIKAGMRVADLTAGLGIDAWHLAANGATVDAIELDEQRASALQANMAAIDNVNVINADCRSFLANHTGPAYDVAFIDPARRDAAGGRVFALADCRPDVIEMLPLLKEKTRELWIKASPMLDITRVLAELPDATAACALGTPTECKELYIKVKFGNAATPVISATTMRTDGECDEFAYTQTEESEAASLCEYSAPTAGQYLYEPSPCIMKAAPFNLISARFHCNQPHPNTHLFFSDSECPDFPGTAHKVISVITYESKHIKRFKREYPKISVTTRNFPVSADALRAKLGVKDGGDLRLFAITSLPDEKLLIVARPL